MTDFVSDLESYWRVYRKFTWFIYSLSVGVFCYIFIPFHQHSLHNGPVYGRGLHTMQDSFEYWIVIKSWLESEMGQQFRHWNPGLWPDCIIPWTTKLSSCSEAEWADISKFVTAAVQLVPPNWSPFISLIFLFSLYLSLNSIRIWIPDIDS